MLKAKFYYSWFEAGREPASVMEFVCKRSSGWIRYDGELHQAWSLLMGMS